MLELKVQLFSFLSSKSYSKDWRAKGMQQSQVSGSRAPKLEKLMKQSSGQCTPLAKVRISEWNNSGTSSWGQPVSPSTPLLWANWEECACARQAWGQKYLHNTFLPQVIFTCCLLTGTDGKVPNSRGGENCLSRTGDSIKHVWTPQISS